MRLLNNARKSLALVTLALLVNGCNDEQQQGKFTGYVEAEYIYLAAPDAGWITSQNVVLGDEVRQGDIVTALDDVYQTLAVSQQNLVKQQKAAQLDDLTLGARQQELAVLQSQLHEAEIHSQLTQLQYQRANQLLNDKMISPSEFDVAKLTYDAAKAKEVTINKQISVLKLGARSGQIIAKQQEVNVADLEIKKSQWQHQQRVITAHQQGIVDEIYFRQGEFVNKGQPVLSLLLPESKKVRFYLPQSAMIDVKLGQTVNVYTADNKAVKANVSYIAKHVEFTPPVLYDNTNRNALVFLIEAKFTEPVAMHPGQPVDVSFND